MEINEIEAAIAAMQDAFQVIQQPRSDYQIERFVVGEKDAEPAAYGQCVLELQVKYNAIRRALLSRQKLILEAAKLRESGDAMDELDAQMKEIDLEETDLAILGAKREFECLYRIWQAFPVRYSYDELQAAQTDYWHKRLVRQAEQDIQATGRIGVGNLDALRMAHLDVQTLDNGQRFYAMLDSAPTAELIELPPNLQAQSVDS